MTEERFHPREILHSSVGGDGVVGSVFLASLLVALHAMTSGSTTYVLTNHSEVTAITRLWSKMLFCLPGLCSLRQEID